MTNAARGLTVVVGVVGLVCLVAATTMNVWFVRMLDMGRLYLAVGLLIALVALAVTLWKTPARKSKTRIAGALALTLGVVATIVNVVWLAPYAPDSVDEVAACPSDQRLRVLVANVQLGNEQTRPLIELAREVEPDILLTMETDEMWDRALSELDDDMPYREQRITGSYYGMHLQSRLPLQQTDIENPAGADTPIIQALVTLPSGADVRFVGVHPRPPHWGQPSVYRDGQLASVALESLDDGPPTVVAGDFNTVPWESTFGMVQDVGGLQDPRRDVGYTATHSANSWWMAWPLDHVLYEPGVRLVRFERGPDIGSDHYPVIAELCADGTGDALPAPTDEAIEDARMAVATARNAPPAK